MAVETVAQSISKAWDDMNTGGEPKADTPAVTTETAQTEELDAPADWEHADREAFRAWQPDTRKAFLTRLDSFQKAKEAQYGEKLKYADEYAPYREIISARAPQLQQRGVQPVQWFQNLAQLDDFATRSPKEFVKWYVQTTGLNPQELFALQQQQAAQQGQEGQYVDPQVSAMQGEIAQLKQMLGQTTQGFQQFQTTLQQQAQARREQEIDQFRNAKGSDGKPAHPYFDEVKDWVVGLLQTGRASDLKSAYDSAVYAHAPTRAKVLADQQAQQRREAEKQQREHAAKAQKAGVSITSNAGSKSNGHDKAKRGESVGETLRRAQAEVEARRH